jgi:hypothetical protein
MTRRSGPSALVLALAVALAGCVTERSKAVPSIAGPVLSRGGGGDGGSWAGQAPVATAAAHRSASPAEAPRLRGPAERRAAPVSYAAHRPLPVGASLEERARERFLGSETTVVAREATVYVPERYAREASLRGASVEEKGPGRRVAVGDAVLTLRRLTVRAASVTFVVRRDGKDDVQLSARGEVSFRSDQPASVLEESGLRGLLLRNDAHTPLR